MKLPEIQNKLKESGLLIFSRLEFRRLLKLSTISAQKLLERYTKKGVFVRLKGGLYAQKLSLPSSYYIANKLYPPSYISFETALSYYNLIPEVVYGVASATTRTTRKYTIENQRYSFHKIKKSAYTGYRLMAIAGERILFAEKEKALADYLYYVFLKKKGWNDRLRPGSVNFKKLLFYISFFKKSGFKEWVENAFRKQS